MTFLKPYRFTMWALVLGQIGAWIAIFARMAALSDLYFPTTAVSDDPLFGFLVVCLIVTCGATTGVVIRALAVRPREMSIAEAAWFWDHPGTAPSRLSWPGAGVPTAQAQRGSDWGPVRWYQNRRRSFLAAAATVAGLALVATSLFVSVTPVYAQSATIDRVVDGDTVDVITGGELVRVRLLNYDAPEHNARTGEGDCLGDTAALRLNELLPSGEDVILVFDEERIDPFGRTLARVIRSDGLDAADRIIREGLGLPIEIGQNTRFSASSIDAAAAAELSRVGLFNEAVGCSPAAIVAAAGAETIAAPADGSSVPEATAYLAALEALQSEFDLARDGLESLTFLPPAYADLFFAELAARAATHDNRVNRAQGMIESAEAWVAALAAEGAAEAQQAAEAAEQERVVQEVLAAQREEAERQAREASAATRSSGAGGATNSTPPAAPAPIENSPPDYPFDAGYTGCRNYNGVGMIDSKGRSFQPITCP